MNTGAFGQSSGLYKFYAQNGQNRPLSTKISKHFYHIMDFTIISHF